MKPNKTKQTVDKNGHQIALAIDGVREFSPVTHQDQRGTLCEMYSTAWQFDDIPIVHAYLMTVRPGAVKGWAYHEVDVDRYFFFNGTARLVLYDQRENSATRGTLMERVYSELNRTLVSVPPGVFHAIECLGTTDALLFNIPSQAYNYENPDKYTLPLNNDVIPYQFDDRRGYR